MTEPSVGDADHAAPGRWGLVLPEGSVSWLAAVILLAAPTGMRRLRATQSAAATPRSLPPVPPISGWVRRLVTTPWANRGPFVSRFCEAVR